MQTSIILRSKKQLRVSHKPFTKTAQKKQHTISLIRLLNAHAHNMPAHVTEEGEIFKESNHHDKDQFAENKLFTDYNKDLFFDSKIFHPHKNHHNLDTSK